MVTRPHGRQAGFTYVGLVVFVAILGMVGAATLKVDSLLRRARAEQELLEIGAAFSAALRSYAAATPRGATPVPPTLQDLLKDPRFPGVRRHLRKIFVDPVTNRAEWGIVWQRDNVGVLAVYSLSQAQPLKVANFDARFPHFESREHLSDWKFTAIDVVQALPAQAPAPREAVPPATPPPPAAPTPAPPPASPADPVPPPAPETAPETAPEPEPAKEADDAQAQPPSAATASGR